MTRYGMLVNTRKCIGCYACREACQHQNKLLDNEPFIRYEERVTGKFPTTDVEMVPMQCMQCTDAPCVSVCPTGASHIGPDGIVVGDLDDPESNVSREIRATGAKPLVEGLTEAAIYYAR